MRAGVALGSNLSDRLANLHIARQEIVDLSGVQPPILSSSIYETDPVGCEPGAGKFLNAVIEFEFDGDASDLLAHLRAIEVALGRGSKHVRNESRTLDLDLLYFGDTTIETRELQLPHPRMHLRRFVLAPLADIRPDLILPNQTRTVRELLASLGESDRVIRLTNDWESQ